MKVSFKYLIPILFLISCNPDSDSSFDASSLIVPDYKFSNHLVECILKDGANLLTLEIFLSDLVKDKFYKNNQFRLRAYFPKVNYKNKFILNIQNNSNEDIYSPLINDLSLKSFDQIASCSFITPELKGISLFDSEIIDKTLPNTSEILKCNYNEGFNYGTFRIAVDRFLNQMSSLKIPYQILYLQDELVADNFIWINNFYSEDYSKKINDFWINTPEAREIKNEFLNNAQCIESNIYYSFAVN